MSGQLLLHDDGGSPERCVICRGLAIGPCARCHRPVCGDCCELTEGGVRTWAVCLSCARGGASLGRRWVGVLLWVLVPALLLAGAALGLVWWRR